MKVDQGDQDRGAWCNFSDLVTYNWFALCCITSNMNPFGKHQLSNWDGTDHPRKDDKGIGVEEPLKFLFGRLARVIIDKNALTVYIPSNQAQDEHKVQPYARKEDQTAMKAVTRVKILHMETLVFHQLAILLTKSQLWFFPLGASQEMYFMSSIKSSSPCSSRPGTFNPTFIEKGSVQGYPGAVIGQGMLVQVVPLALDWPSENYYGGPAIEMGLRYLEYEIKPEDNSRIIILAVYVDGQNLKVNLVRFREMLIEAMEPLGGSTP
ncbi:unnamed protein product [Prunus armeniaca]